MNHSPEPWTIECATGSIPMIWPTIEDANGKTIVYPPNQHTAIADLPNLHRITAAVNFCQNLPTDFLLKYSAHLCDGFGTLADIPNLAGLIPVRITVP